MCGRQRAYSKIRNTTGTRASLSALRDCSLALIYERVVKRGFVSLELQPPSMGFLGIGSQSQEFLTIGCKVFAAYLDTN